MDDTPEPEARSRFGESEADALLTEAYRREYHNLVTQTRGRLSRHKGDRSDNAEEIVSRSLYKALLKGPLESLTRFIVYWRAIVANETRNEYRHDDTRRAAEPALQHELPQTDPSPELMFLEEEQRRVLHETVEALPPRQRLTLRWRLWEGLSSAEVAHRFAAEKGIQISERQVARYFNAGCDACRQALKGLEDGKTEGIK